MVQKVCFFSCKVVGLLFLVSFCCLLSACNLLRETQGPVDKEPTCITLPPAWTATSTPISSLSPTASNTPNATPTLTPLPRGTSILPIATSIVEAKDEPRRVDVEALVIDPITPTTLYAGTDSGDVLKSLDGGRTWNDASNGLPKKSVYALAIDPITPTTLYAGTWQSGVFKSMDGGETWR